MSSVGARRRCQKMLQDLAEKGGIRDLRVLEAMGRIARHEFVQKRFQAQAYSDHALPIGCDQTISQPYIVARTTELLEIEPTHSVLEIGTGSGYHTAVLAQLAGRVYSLERVPELAKGALGRIRELGFDNVKIQIFDGTVGWSDVGPFDRILVLASAPKAPPPLLKQLKDGGRLVIPEGGRKQQHLVLYQRDGDAIRRTEVEPAAFVPLIGRHGWKEKR